MDYVKLCLKKVKYLVTYNFIMLDSSCITKSRSVNYDKGRLIVIRYYLVDTNITSLALSLAFICSLDNQLVSKILSELDTHVKVYKEVQ